MSFSRWRQQFSVVLAVKWLAGGASIQQVAADLGYQSVPQLRDHASKGAWHFAGALHGGTTCRPALRFQGFSDHSKRGWPCGQAAANQSHSPVIGQLEFKAR
jgi:hypothetical protein